MLFMNLRQLRDGWNICLFKNVLISVKTKIIKMVKNLKKKYNFNVDKNFIHQPPINGLYNVILHLKMPDT